MPCSQRNIERKGMAWKSNHFYNAYIKILAWCLNRSLLWWYTLYAAWHAVPFCWAKYTQKAKAIRCLTTLLWSSPAYANSLAMAWSTACRSKWWALAPCRDLVAMPSSVLEGCCSLLRCAPAASWPVAPQRNPLTCVCCPAVGQALTSLQH